MSQIAMAGELVRFLERERWRGGVRGGGDGIVGGSLLRFVAVVVGSLDGPSADK
jgi:hypothetical protein